MDFFIPAASAAEAGGGGAGMGMIDLLFIGMIVLV